MPIASVSVVTVCVNSHRKKKKRGAGAKNNKNKDNNHHIYMALVSFSALDQYICVLRGIFLEPRPDGSG